MTLRVAELALLYDGMRRGDAVRLRAGAPLAQLAAELLEGHAAAAVVFCDRDSHRLAVWEARPHGPTQVWTLPGALVVAPSEDAA